MAAALASAQAAAGGQAGWLAGWPRTHRDVAVDDQQLLPRHVKLAAQLVGLPVDYSEPLVVWVED